MIKRPIRVDDAAVLNSCLRKIESQDPELSQNITAAMRNPRR